MGSIRPRELAALPHPETSIRSNQGLHCHLVGGVHFRVARSAVAVSWAGHVVWLRFSFPIDPVTHPSPQLLRVFKSSFFATPLPFLTGQT